MRGDDDDDEEMLNMMLKDAPEQVRQEVEELSDLLAVEGCTLSAIRHAVVELFSVPRVTKELKEMSQRIPMGLSAGSTFDMCMDENGKKYDFRTARDRKRCWARLEVELPWLVVGCPPCAFFSIFNQNLNRERFTKEEWRRREAEALVLLHFAISVYRWQLRRGAISCTSTPRLLHRGQMKKFSVFFATPRWM